MTHKAEILLVAGSRTGTEPIRQALGENAISFNLHLVRDCEEALEFLYRKGQYKHAPSPDILLLEMDSPSDPGWECLHVLKGDRNTRMLPVLVFSGANTAEDVARAYDLGANAYHTKTTPDAVLRETMESLMSFWFDVATLPIKRRDHTPCYSV